MKFIVRLFMAVIVFYAGFFAGGVYFADKGVVFEKIKNVLTKEVNKASFVKDAPISDADHKVNSNAENSKTKTVQENLKPKEGRIFTIQVASFKDLSQTKQFVDKLLNQDYDAYIAPNNVPGNEGWYRVCIGEYLNREQANAKLQKLKLEFKDSFVQQF